MAPTKKKPASTARDKTRATNANLDIDFSAGMTVTELAVEKAQTRSVWVNKLIALNEGIDAGQGDLDTFYKLGEFTSASGARTTIRELSKRPERLPGEFVMESRIVVRDGKRTSELWVAVPSDQFEMSTDPSAEG